MRGIERYGVRLTDNDLIVMTKMIQGGQAEFMERESNRATKWLLNYNGIAIPLVYDTQRKSIATILPPTAAELQRHLARKEKIAAG